MEKKYVFIIALCAFLLAEHRCYGQLPKQAPGTPKQSAIPAKTIIRVTALDVNTKLPMLNPLDYPALGSTNIAIKPDETPRFFMDQFNSTDIKGKLELLLQAPCALLKQFERSKNPVIIQNPWFLYQGLEDIKKLKKEYEHELKTKMEPLRNGFLRAFNMLLCELSLIRISTTQGKMSLGELWFNATTIEHREALLKEITDAVIADKSEQTRTELVGFIGVLGHAFSVPKRVESLQRLLDADPENMSYARLIKAVFDDIQHGPDAKTIAQMAIRDRNLKA